MAKQKKVIKGNGAWDAERKAAVALLTEIKRSNEDYAANWLQNEVTIQTLKNAALVDNIESGLLPVAQSTSPTAKVLSESIRQGKQFTAWLRRYASLVALDSIIPALLAGTLVSDDAHAAIRYVRAVKAGEQPDGEAFTLYLSMPVNEQGLDRIMSSDAPITYKAATVLLYWKKVGDTKESRTKAVAGLRYSIGTHDPRTIASTELTAWAQSVIEVEKEELNAYYG